MSRLTKYIMKVHNIDSIDNSMTKEIPALELINPRRFDIMAKYLYGKCLLNGYDVKFAKELYLAHIDIFSNGTFVEPDGEGKEFKEDYINSFFDTLESIKTRGFDAEETLLPLGSHGEILDGAHRLTAALLLGENVTTVDIDEANASYDYLFFKNKGLKPEYLDFMAYQYCKLSKKTFVACIWPSAEGKELEVKELFNKYGKIVYQKQVLLNHKGQGNFLSQIYSHFDWIGTYKDNFKGVFPKTVECFKNDGPIRVLAFESDSLDTVLTLKDEVRKLFNIGNHSIHISDNPEETIQIAELLFNKNSILHLNNSKPTKYKDFFSILKNYRNKLLSNNMNIDDYLIDSSGVLGIYGLRSPEDLDFFSMDPQYHIIEDNIMGEHNSELSFHNLSKEEILLNPAMFFITMALSSCQSAS